MAFRRTARKTTSHGFVGSIRWCVHGVFWLTTRLVLSSIVVTGLALAVLYLRLLQGPIALPALGQMVIEAANAEAGGKKIHAAEMVFDLGDHKTPTGLEFRDVRIDSANGDALFAAPSVRAGFRFADLVRGRVRLQRLTLLEADLQVVRAEDGRLRLGLNEGAGILLEPSTGTDSPEPGGESWAELFDGFVGDAPPIPQLEALEQVAILGTNIAYSDRQNGGQWRADGADLVLKRDETGARAVLEVDEFNDATAGLFRFVADRRTGSGTTTFQGQFGQVDPSALARTLPVLSALTGVKTVIEGRFSGEVGREGEISPIQAILISEGGSVELAGEPRPFEMAMLRLGIDPARKEIQLDDALLIAPDVEARLGGILGLSLGSDGRVQAVRGQVDLAFLNVPLPDVLAVPVVVEDGQLLVDWRPDNERLDVAESWVRSGDDVFHLTGRVGSLNDQLQVDLRAEAVGLDVGGLLDRWPLTAAKNARDWTRRNISSARIDAFLAQFSMDGDETDLSLNVSFSEMTASYVPGMSPFQQAAGEIWLEEERMILSVDRARVVPARGQALTVSDSNIEITGFSADVTDANVALTASGPTAGVLSLIDQKPLNLVQKLGLDLTGLDGSAEISASLKFPLIQDLAVDQVDVATSAVVRDIRLPLDLGLGQPIDVAAERLTIDADVNQMRLAGAARLNGTPVDVEWRENYAVTPGTRTLLLEGQATSDLLRGFGLDGDMFGGTAGIDLTLTQQGAAPPRFDVTADLRNAAVTLDAIGWQKPVGARGRLKVNGTAGTPIALESVALDTDSLSARGTISLDDDGELRSAALERVRIPGQLDAAVTIGRGPDGVQEIALDGRLLDVSDLEDSAGGAASPIRATLNLDELRLTRKLALSSARGTVARLSDGSLKGRMSGTLGPVAPVELSLELGPDGNGDLVLTSPNAGAALRAADIYRDARGGSLALNARIEGGEGGGIEGTARIEDVTVRSQATFREVLEDGGLNDAGAEVADDGIGFRKVWIPFKYQGGVVEISEALAVSPALGLKLTGTLNEETERLDLAGVLSPAYGVTGALNDIPLIGAILGGEGEGVFGMTFTLSGAMRDPDLTVNPLSLLAPGILRKIFSGTGVPDAEAEAIDERFRRQQD